MSAARQIPEDTAEHIPHLPEAGTLTSTDRICSEVFPTKRGRPGIERVFHEAGPVAYCGPGEAVIRCIHCAREFT